MTIDDEKILCREEKILCSDEKICPLLSGCVRRRFDTADRGGFARAGQLNVPPGSLIKVRRHGEGNHDPGQHKERHVKELSFIARR